MFLSLQYFKLGNSVTYPIFDSSIKEYTFKSSNFLTWLLIFLKIGVSQYVLRCNDIFPLFLSYSPIKKYSTFSYMALPIHV